MSVKEADVTDVVSTAITMEDSTTLDGLILITVLSCTVDLGPWFVELLVGTIQECIINNTHNMIFVKI